MALFTGEDVRDGDSDGEVKDDGKVKVDGEVKDDDDNVIITLQVHRVESSSQPTPEAGSKSKSKRKL